MSNQWIRGVETWIGQTLNKKRRDLRLAKLAEGRDLNLKKLITMTKLPISFENPDTG